MYIRDVTAAVLVSAWNNTADAVSDMRLEVGECVYITALKEFALNVNTSNR